MKVGELVEGMLLAPVTGKGWWISDWEGSPTIEDHPYMRTNNIQNCNLGCDPAIYVGKIKFKKSALGLYTYHQLLYNGTIYLVDGYEFHGRIDPL